MTSAKTLALTTSTALIASEIDITYYVTCSLNLSGQGHIAVTASGTPRDGTIIEFICNFNTTNYLEGTDDITFYGFTVPLEIATKVFYTIASYNSGAWRVFFLPSLQNLDLIDAGLIKTGAVGQPEIADASVGTGEVIDLNITTSKLAANAASNAKLAQMTTLTIKGNDGGVTADPQDLSVTEVRTMLDQDITLTGDISGTDTEDPATGITTIVTAIGAGKVGVVNLSNTLKNETIYFPVSFETGEKGAFYIKVGYNCDVIEYMCSVYKLIEATDNATIVLANNTPTTMSGSTLTLPGGSAIGTNVNVTSGTITSNFSLTAGQTIRVTTAKTTAGGKGMVSLKLQRT